MKKYFFILFIPLFLLSCSKKEEKKLEAFNPEAFAFNVDNGWEVNASVRVKGFQQNKKGIIYTTQINYRANILSADGKVVESQSDVINEENNEQFIDLPVEVQFAVDSTHASGMYKVEFLITDASNKEAKVVKNVELQKE